MVKMISQYWGETNKKMSSGSLNSFRMENWTVVWFFLVRFSLWENQNRNLHQTYGNNSDYKRWKDVTLIMATTTKTTTAEATKKTVLGRLFSSNEIRISLWFLPYARCKSSIVSMRSVPSFFFALRASRRRYRFLNGNRSNRKWIICLHWGEWNVSTYANGMWFNFRFSFVLVMKLRRNLYGFTFIRWWE